jgi:hypothetical protein
MIFTTIHFNSKSDTLMLSQKLCPVHFWHILQDQQLSPLAHILMIRFGYLFIKSFLRGRPTRKRKSNAAVNLKNPAYRLDLKHTRPALLAGVLENLANPLKFGFRFGVPKGTCKVSLLLEHPYFIP